MPEIARLRLRLEEAEETIRAIRAGAVDAFVVQASSGPQIYTLQSADRPYRLLVEEMQQGALTLDNEGAIAYCNRRFGVLVGKASEQLVGIAFRDLIPLDAQAEYGRLLAQGRIACGQGETHVLHAAGAVVPVLLTFNALPPDSGAAIGLVVTDLTAQRHHEEVGVLLGALREADRRKNEFLAMLGHELRGPLAPIVSALQVLALQNGSESPTQQQARGIIERQARHLQHLVDDLLEVSRITTGKLQVRHDRIAVGDIVEGALEAIRPLMQQRRHELTVSLPREPIWLRGDGARLEQVLQNLLGNAAKYTEEGGHVWLNVESANGSPSVPAHVVIRVRDDGVGVDPALLPRIFDLFTQAKRSLDRSEGGLGIGLALAQQITELHGGTIEAESELGQGSQFVVRLPVPTMEEPRLPAPAPEAEPAARPLRVLVVDDNADTLLTFSMLLRTLGHDVQTAHDGTTAVQAALDYQPDVALLDIGLPGLNGYQVAKRIRQEPVLEHMMLVALTGYGQDSDRKTSLEAGFNHHLVKPARLEQVRKILATVPLA